MSLKSSFRKNSQVQNMGMSMVGLVETTIKESFFKFIFGLVQWERGTLGEIPGFFVSRTCAREFKNFFNTKCSTANLFGK